MIAADRHRQTYLDEAAELLADLESSLLELESSPEDSELVGHVFRALHTIKGSGAMFGFDAVASFTHEVETVFDDVRAGRIPVTPELVGVALDARDHIRRLLQEDASDAATQNGELILERLRQTLPGAGSQTQLETPADVATTEPSTGAMRTYRVSFVPHADIFLNGSDPVPLIEELRQLGECSVVAHIDWIPELNQLDPETCYVGWDAVLTTAASENEIRDVFIFVEDHAKIAVEPVSSRLEAGRLRLGEILVARGDVAAEDVESRLSRPRVGDLLVEANVISRDRVEAAALEQRHLDSLREKQQKIEAAATLRVSATKLDGLVNIVGELVTVQARLSGYALASGAPEIHFIAEEVERLTERLRESTMSIRMLPIGDTFNRFKRLVRDLSGELGKRVELVMEGGDTELDKTVIEQLSDPLVHLVRNAVDHGIEMPEKRLDAGKSAVGRVHLSACHSGAFVLIRVADDGAGMNRDAIRARAIQRGLIAADAAVADQELFALTLKPGFSTSERVTEISGRGVGMDVVQRSLDALRGSLSVTSEVGKGTVVTLKIPLTLAIIDGLLVEAAGAFYVVPLSNISECIELQRRGASARRSLVTVRDELVPYVALRERFSLPGKVPEIEQVIIADTREGKCGFVVDRVIGDHHTVIKKLGHLYRHVEEISGATILGDGTVALILDVEKLAAELVRESRQTR